MNINQEIIGIKAGMLFGSVEEIVQLLSESDCVIVRRSGDGRWKTHGNSIDMRLPGGRDDARKNFVGARYHDGEAFGLTGEGKKIVNKKDF